MTAAFPIDCYRSEIAQVTESVFETMLEVAVRPAMEAAAGRPEFTAAVYYAGAWQGALLLECSSTQAQHWAARFMSLAPPVPLDDARDGLGELANVIAGNLKPLLPPGVSLSMPSVVQGDDYRLRICGGNLFDNLNFADDLGPFRITLVEVTEQAK
jgi:chemotaxis protein CheX